MKNRLEDLQQEMERVRQSNKGDVAAANAASSESMQYSSIFALEQEVARVRHRALQETFSEAKVVDYQAEFTTDIEKFLRTYALFVDGALGNQINGGGNTVGALIGGGFAGVAGNTLVDLTAPPVYGHLALDAAATNQAYIPISAEKVRMRFDNVATGIPIYLIPYQGGRSLGVKLPRGNTVAYAITATLNGCTVEISGSDTEPYVSHSNVINVTHAVPATQATNRQLAMTARLAGLKVAFATAETGSGNIAPGLNNIYNPNHNPLNFAFYVNHAPPGYAGTTVDYRQDVEQAVTALAAGTPPTPQKGVREDTSLITHVRYMLTLTPASLETHQDPRVPPNAIVLARRSAGAPGQWTFYYQEYTGLTFSVSEKAKIGPKLVTGTKDLGNKNATVVVNSGKLWPPPVTQTFARLL